MVERDFFGYGASLPDPGWPDGARIAVSFVVNVEEGAELSIADGDERNEAVYEITDEVYATLLTHAATATSNMARAPATGASCARSTAMVFRAR